MLLPFALYESCKEFQSISTELHDKLRQREQLLEDKEHSIAETESHHKEVAARHLADQEAFRKKLEAQFHACETEVIVANVQKNGTFLYYVFLLKKTALFCFTFFCWKNGTFSVTHACLLCNATLSAS
jgi:hypothetical protein